MNRIAANGELLSSAGHISNRRVSGIGQRADRIDDFRRILRQSTGPRAIRAGTGRNASTRQCHRPRGAAPHQFLHGLAPVGQHAVAPHADGAAAGDDARAKAIHAIAGRAHRHGRLFRQQHLRCHQVQHADRQHSAIAVRHHPRADPRPELPGPDRRDALRARASPSTRAKAIATNSSSAASIPARTSSSTAFATTCSISATCTTRRASRC